MYRCPFLAILLQIIQKTTAVLHSQVLRYNGSMIFQNNRIGNEIVDKTCNLVIDNQKQYRESVKKLISYNEDKEGNKT
ncbi:hypothetical protein BH23THE1_BH23THE1_13610 [soil metagenome]